MRIFYLLPLLGLVFTSGCSAFIAMSGLKLDELKTSEAVHEVFAGPSSESAADGGTSETYFTRRKVAQPSAGTCLGMMFTGTLGFSELFCFPTELCLVGKEMIAGQYIRFTFDRDGKVIRVIQADTESSLSEKAAELASGSEDLNSR